MDSTMLIHHDIRSTIWGKRFWKLWFTISWANLRERRLEVDLLILHGGTQLGLNYLPQRSWGLMTRPCQLQSVFALLRCFSPLSKDTTCVWVSIRRKDSRIFLLMGMSVRYSQPPTRLGVSFLPTLRFGARLFSRKNTATSCRKSRYLGGGGRILDPSTSWRCQQGFEPTRETTKFGRRAKKKTSKELPKVAARPTKKAVYFEDSYVKCTVWCETDDLFASDLFFQHDLLWVPGYFGWKWLNQRNSWIMRTATFIYCDLGDEV